MTLANRRIGFMQGRLSELVEGKIQAFPWREWRDEFARAQSLGICRMEWTIDQDRLRENPLTTREGQLEILQLSRAFGLSVTSVTGDCFMQAPFWKSGSAVRSQLLEDLDLVLTSSSALGIRILILPLVDNGSIETPGQRDLLVETLLERSVFLKSLGVQIAFESDAGPAELSEFIDLLPRDLFGINYDIGNSAALGYDCVEEVAAYSGRILNVHVKDRMRAGTTVPLEAGAANLPLAISLIERAGYDGQYILQTARASTGKHAQALTSYRDLVLKWLEASV